jgi:deazaflavin-dependent oxidoreductase (nitroreductase family)
VPRAVSRAIAGLVLAVSAIGVVFVTGMRRKSPAVVDRVRVLGRTMRPLAIRSAGGPGASASVISHVGRSSGRAYSTPVAAVPVDDGFLVALPYGRRADWLKNVLAGGSATIGHDGGTYEVDRPEIIAISSVEDRFSPADQRAHRLFGVDECVRLRRVDADPESLTSSDSPTS